MEKQYSLKNPLKQTPYEILKGVLFKILQSSLFIRHYATNLALIQEKLEVSTKIYHRFKKVHLLNSKNTSKQPLTQK